MGKVVEEIKRKGVIAQVQFTPMAIRHITLISEYISISPTIYYFLGGRGCGRQFGGLTRQIIDDGIY